LRYLFDIGHPAHIHYFKHTIRELEKNGHQVALTARDKEITLYLIAKYGFPYHCTGRNLSTKLGKLYSILRNDLKIYKVARQTKPDLFVSFFSPFAAHVGRFLRKPVIGFNDTENAKISITFAEPFTDTIVVPDCYKGTLAEHKKITFDGYFELAYLHPNHFTPDPGILDLLRVRQDEKFVRGEPAMTSAIQDYQCRTNAAQLKFCQNTPKFLSPPKNLCPKICKNIKSIFHLSACTMRFFMQPCCMVKAPPWHRNVLFWVLLRYS
jgi:predicted glycosyltransferase